MKSNDQLLTAAKEAIAEFHSDDRVSHETTLDGLEELQADIESMAQALRDDIRRMEAEPDGLDELRAEMREA